MHSKLQIDQIIQYFYQQFDCRSGRPELNQLHRFFAPHAVIVYYCETTVEVSNLATFITPRQRMFDANEIQDFHEWEIKEKTYFMSNMAQRQSRYQKLGIVKGRRIETCGDKFFQLVYDKSEWKICALCWQDKS